MYSYIVKVRERSYLWGSGGISTDSAWPLLLVVNNDHLGDPIGIGSESANGGTDMGTLQPGECWTVPLLGLRGVYATCASDSTVACTILLPQFPAAS